MDELFGENPPKKSETSNHVEKKDKQKKRDRKAKNKKNKEQQAKH